MNDVINQQFLSYVAACVFLQLLLQTFIIVFFFNKLHSLCTKNVVELIFLFHYLYHCVAINEFLLCFNRLELYMFNLVLILSTPFIFIQSPVIIWCLVYVLAYGMSYWTWFFIFQCCCLICLFIHLFTMIANLLQWIQWCFSGNRIGLSFNARQLPDDFPWVVT